MNRWVKGVNKRGKENKKINNKKNGKRERVRSPFKNERIRVKQRGGGGQGDTVIAKFYS